MAKRMTYAVLKPPGRKSWGIMEVVYEAGNLISLTPVAYFVSEEMARKFARNMQWPIA